MNHRYLHAILKQGYCGKSGCKRDHCTFERYCRHTLDHDFILHNYCIIFDKLLYFVPLLYFDAVHYLILVSRWTLTWLLHFVVSHIHAVLTEVVLIARFNNGYAYFHSL